MKRYEFGSSTLTLERLKTLLHYDPETGLWTWRVNKGRVKAGSIAGCSTRGYWVLRVDQHNYLSHILAWFYMTGEWPEHEVDHRDLDKGNNHWDNLRPATDVQQEWNKPPSNEGHDLRSNTDQRGARVYGSVLYVRGGGVGPRKAR